MYNKNFYVESWIHEDFVTGENYNLFINNEVDSIILCFTSSEVLVSKIEFTDGNGLSFNTNLWTIVNIKNQPHFKRDEFTIFRLTELDNQHMIWEGEHSLHKQKQRITINFKEIKESSIIVDYLRQRFL